MSALKRMADAIGELPTGILATRKNLRDRACGNNGCSVSTGIHDGLTFGRGRLGDHGFWSIPCAPCARDFEKRFPDEGPCWPFEESRVVDGDKR